jgi:uncharacterized protein YciI
MSYFVVIREAGPAWAQAVPLREQQQWTEHAAFMDALVEDGFIVLGGPLGGGPTTLLVVDAGSEDEIRTRLADDPWTPTGMLEISKIEAWEILLGSVS